MNRALKVEIVRLEAFLFPEAVNTEQNKAGIRSMREYGMKTSDFFSEGNGTKTVRGSV